jgi:hypothetical protein
MAHLHPLEHDVVVYVEQRYEQNRAWLEPDARRFLTFRMRLLYYALGINRPIARTLERTATAATGGWRAQDLPQGWRDFVHMVLFDSLI